MKDKTIRFAALACILVLISALSAAVAAQKPQNQIQELKISSWLLLGPLPAPLPPFQRNQNRGIAVDGLLKFSELDISNLLPDAEKTHLWYDGKKVQWKKIQSKDEGITLAGDTQIPSVAYLGVYIDVKRWTNAVFNIKCPQAFRVYFDGKIVSTKSKVNKTEEGKASVEGRKTSVDLKLETGKHLLLIKTVHDPSSNSDWTLNTNLSINAKFASSRPYITVSPDRHMTIAHLLDGPKVTGVSISSCGTLAAVSIRQTLPPSDSSESWIELCRIADNILLRTYRGGTSISRITWAPTERKFSYISRDKSGGALWVVDLKTGTSTPILKNIKNLGSHTWSPNADFIVYSITEEKKPDKSGVKRLKNMADRQPGWRDRSYLYKVSLPDGVRQRLTAGELSTYLNSISPDGKTLLYTRTVVDYTERPYSKSELHTLDLQTLKSQQIWKGSWLGNTQWSPDGKKILALGGPTTFANTGVNIINGLIPNDYDTQAYVLDPETKKVEPITKAFNPAISQAIWSEVEDCIYFVTTDRAYRHLYRYDLKKKTYSLIDLGVEVVGQFDISHEKPVAVYTGSSAAIPPKAFTIDLDSKKYRLLKDPGKKDFAKVKFGKVERWTFKNKIDVEIEGRIYYPPDFNPNKKYPCIVYYYGGTSPVTRDFGGRYPKNLYAAQGYVVYILQPSGAIGFGQTFSAAHVNDWGIIVADEIIDGVKKFLAAHPFVDPKRVGCMGASYGGFMTMLLQTRTNMFAAAISHAGISSISSYWGEGYWGYAYSATATANSFPWNRKDIYIEQSALFNADKITTPLLLLHGSVDTNVPPGESTQLFTALKILGREVEYIQILDQNHHIMTYNKRILWTKTIMAWFDRWLKGQPEWWYNLYPNH